jgi:hypothetical protein
VNVVHPLTSVSSVTRRFCELLDADASKHPRAVELFKQHPALAIMNLKFGDHGGTLVEYALHGNELLLCLLDPDKAVLDGERLKIMIGITSCTRCAYFYAILCYTIMYLVSVSAQVL